MPLLIHFGVLVCVVFGVQDDDRVSLLQAKTQKPYKEWIVQRWTNIIGNVSAEMDYFQIRANFGANGYCLTIPFDPQSHWGYNPDRSQLRFEPCSYDGNGKPNNHRQRWISVANTHLVSHFTTGPLRDCIDIEYAKCNPGADFHLWFCHTNHWNAQFAWDWIDPSNHSKQMKFFSADKVHLNNGTRGCDMCLDMVDATSETDWNAPENQQKSAVLWPCKDVPATFNQAFEMKPYCLKTTNLELSIDDPSNTHVEGACLPSAALQTQALHPP